MEFTKILKEVRLLKNLTQKQVANILGVVESCYANWEQGRTEPSIDNIVRLCAIFDVSSDYLLGIVDESGARNKELLNVIVKKK